MEIPRDQRIKRILYRTWYRGCKETDNILGSFARAFAPQMTDADMDQLEAILEEQDADLFHWLTGQKPLPERYKGNAVMEKLMRFDVAENTAF